MSEIISIITSTPWIMEVLKPVACVIAVLLVEIAKAIAGAVCKKRNVVFNKKKYEYLFLVVSFIIAFGAVIVYTYFVNFVNWDSTIRDASLYAGCTQTIYYIIQSPRKFIEACKKSTVLAKIIAFICKIFAKKATPEDVKDITKELTAVEKFYQAIEK